MISIPPIPDRQRPMLRFLLVLSVASMVGLQGWRTLLNNFAVEWAHLDGNHMGIVQSVREIPGFLALLAVWAMLLVREHRLSALSILVLGIGVGLTGFFPSFPGLVATTMLMSFGFHYYETTNQSLTLQYFDPSTAPLVLGAIRSLSAATNIAVGIMVFVMSSFLDYRMMFLVVGALVVVVGTWGMGQNPVDHQLTPQRKDMVFRWEYRLFYFLTFMAGARRQIFIAFSVFLLVKVFGFSVREVTVLFVLNNAVSYFAAPRVGKAIVRFGERRVLTVEYAGMVLIFLAYALTRSRWIAAGLYVADNLLFNFTMAIRTYFQKVADQQDIAPSMAVGFTINHIAAVILPAVGGVLWVVDYRIPFLAASGLSMISLLAVQFIPSGPGPTDTILNPKS
ncbi:MAG: MFS transporter [bacterium]|nr:MAG: MFS transporter [bacterium]